MNRIEKFDTTSRKVENPKVSDVGIKKALIIWRSRRFYEYWKLSRLIGFEFFFI